MPIYEYRCTSCKTELEKLQKISDPPLVECPECGKHTLIKLISASSFRLKGSGWYETDFKTGKKKNGAAEESAGSGTAESGSASADAGDKAATKDTDGKSALESSSKGSSGRESGRESGSTESGSRERSSKNEPGSTQPKGETKTTAEAKPSTGSGGSHTKSS